MEEHMGTKQGDFRAAREALEIETIDLDDEGFLSPGISTWIEQIRQENSEWFELAWKLNRIGQRQLVALMKVTGMDTQKFLSALLFMRGLQNAQSAVMLAERGMTSDALALARSIFEAVFRLDALHRNKDFVSRFVRDDMDRRSKLVRVFLDGNVGTRTFDATETARLNRFLDEARSSGPTLPIFDGAKGATLHQFYDGFFRGISDDLVHASLATLRRHVRMDDKGHFAGFQWGPDVLHVADALRATAFGWAHLITLSHEIFGEDAPMPGFEQCWAEYQRLVTEMPEHTPLMD